MDGQQHLEEPLERGEIIVGLVEETMPQTGTDQDAEEAVEQEGVEELVLDLLLLVQTAHDEVGDDYTDEPAQGVPAEGHGANGEGLNVWVPEDVIQDIGHCLFGFLRAKVRKNERNTKGKQGFLFISEC